MKIILVTGGAGFIASNLIKFLIKKKFIKKIYSLDNYSTGKVEKHIISKKIKYIKGNTLKLNSYQLLKKIKFDTIFHFAEFSRIVPSFKYYDCCWQSNSIGTFEVIKFALKNKAKLIYSASSSTIGNNKYLSPYSWTKYTNNELIKNFSKWFGLKYVIVYFYNVYGPNQISEGYMSAVIGIFEKQYKEKKSLTVVQPGTQTRDFTHVEDIINGTYRAAKKTVNSEFHIGSNKNHSILEVAKMFKYKYIFVDKLPGERFNSMSDTSKAIKVLNYKPRHNLKKYIEEFIKKNS